MARFEVQGPDGKTYEVEAGSMEEAASALGSFGAPPQGGSAANKEAVSDLGNRLTVLGANASNAMAFGLGDEFVGAIEGLDSMRSGGDYLPAYREGRDNARSDMDVVNEAYPKEAAGGNITGAVIPALTSAPLGVAKTLLGTMSKGAGLGAVEGGLQGAGNADGEDLAANTIEGLLIGGGAGAAAPAIVGALGAAKNAVLDPIKGLFDTAFNRANTGKVNRAVAEALQKSGQTEQHILDALVAAKTAGQSEFRLMDALGLPGQRQASGLVRAGGGSGQEVADFLATRQSGQGERVGAFVEDAFDVGGTTAAKTREGLVKDRSASADVAYEAARSDAAPVDVRGALGVIDARTKGMGGSGVTGDGIDSKLLGYRSRLAAQPGPDGVSRELSDFDRVLGVKQAIQDDIEVAKRAGRNNEARELIKLANELDAALEASSDGYRAANDGFRSASRVIDAVDEGGMMATRGRAADNTPKFGAMAAAEQGAARVGYGDRLLDQLEQIASPTSNRAKPLQSPKRTAEAEVIAQDFPLYSERLGRENTMWETQNRALGGSRTADNLADQEAMDSLAGGTLGALKSGANLQFGDAVSKIAAMFAPFAKGQNEATRAMIVKALLSGDGAALAPAIAQAANSETVRAFLASALRQPLREGNGG